MYKLHFEYENVHHKSWVQLECNVQTTVRISFITKFECISGRILCPWMFFHSVHLSFLAIKKVIPTVTKNNTIETEKLEALRIRDSNWQRAPWQVGVAEKEGVKLRVKAAIHNLILNVCKALLSKLPFWESKFLTYKLILWHWIRLVTTAASPWPRQFY
jgi:hypothetical protein